MSVVAGIFKGLGAGLIGLGVVLVLFGLVTAVTGYGEVSEEADKENDGNPFTRGDEDKAETGANMALAGLAGAGVGVIGIVLGMVVFFTAKGAQERAQHKARMAQILPSIEE